MRTILTMGAAVLLTGCGLDALTSAAVQSEMAAKNAKQGASVLTSAKNLKGTLELEHAVNAYRAAKGHYPPSLQALVPDWLPQLPEHPTGGPWAYDPQTGQVSAAPPRGAPAAPAPQGPAITAEDQQHMREIASALRRFYRDTKRVPHSLWELAPDYLENVPKTSDGRAFVYDPRSASIFHPAQFDRRAQQPGPRSQGPRGGQPGLGGATDAYNRAQEEALGQTGF